MSGFIGSTSGCHRKQQQQQQQQQQHYQLPRQQQQQQQQQHYQLPRQQLLLNGDKSSIGSDSRHSSCNPDYSDVGSVLTGALNELRVQCPNCAHRFPLSEGLLMTDPGDDDAALAPSAASVSAAAAAAAAMPQQTDPMDCGASKYGPRKSENLADEFATSSKGTLVRVNTNQFGSNCSDASTVEDGADYDEAAQRNSDEKTSEQQISRSYQILNWTVEQLEKVICDPNDRRIRKITSITQCDIEIRSEMSQSKFGAPKNFCILRASQPLNVEQCCSLLKRQLHWVLKPKTHDAEPAK